MTTAQGPRGAERLSELNGTIAREIDRLIVKHGWSLSGIADHLSALGAWSKDETPGELLRELRRILMEGAPIAQILSHLRAFAGPSRKATIGTLPPEIRAELDRLFRDGRHTIDQIVTHLRGLGADVSRSAVGRARKTYEERLSRYREAQEVAGVWVTKMGEDPKGDVGQLCAEMLKTVAFQTLSDMVDGPAEADDGGTPPSATPADIMLLAKAIKDLEGAKKTSVDTALKVRKELAAQIDRKLRTIEADAATAVETDPVEARLALLRRVREEIYGIVDR